MVTSLKDTGEEHDNITVMPGNNRNEPYEIIFDEG